jgi:acetyl esterase/lipase
MVGVTGGVKEFDAGENLDQSSRVQCVVDYYGPTNFGRMNEQGTGKGSADGVDHNHADSPESLLLGGPVSEMKEQVKRADPCTYASADDPPMLILHGLQDRLVPHGQSEILAEALRAAGAPVTFVPRPEAGHGDGFGETEQKIAEAFLVEHLKPRSR